jgi:hypothetical protein
MVAVWHWNMQRQCLRPGFPLKPEATACGPFPIIATCMGDSAAFKCRPSKSPSGPTVAGPSYSLHQGPPLHNQSQTRMLQRRPCPAHASGRSRNALRAGGPLQSIFSARPLGVNTVDPSPSGDPCALWIRSGVRIKECCVHPSVVAAPIASLADRFRGAIPGPACGWCLQGPIGWPRHEAGHDGRAGAPLPAAAGSSRPGRRATCACIFALEVGDRRTQCCMSTAACLKAVRQQQFATSRSPRHPPGPAFPCAVNPDPWCPTGVWLRRPPLAIGMSFC